MSSAEVSMIHPLGPTSVEDWLVEEQPSDGSRLELILGYLHVTPAPSGPHQYASLELACLLRDALKAAGRSDLRVLPAVAVRINTAFRTGVIPDIVVVDTDINQTSFAPENVVLAVEIWSPGNTREERDTKIAGYASARVPYLWVVEMPTGKPVTFSGYAMGEHGYRQEVRAAAGETVKAPAPVPIVVNTAELR
ncbi:Uma2 family endonuclease [Nocardia cyriacigeorgica]|uniref:Uma2 family endonuclease n=2 Tax=Nocardia cyriacigeorgica TaxID=135487 RepID=UPI0009D9F0E5|nr:Uma2 family endonuclease [Nocardia cyriacigeorgica]AVH22894.1 Uma2 family endonuclease [Nocardia cyriacigeorgica]MBF6081060.1 Uma2 family endonuclease [Nocardia cyriacigeorgica]MBF6284944.1 Uma2 family endonuclease [Nocardia cyriacigeorgica]PPJ16598.1 Uma2 family endonuclease [Nocardia cyriacigeorgica]